MAIKDAGTIDAEYTNQYQRMIALRPGDVEALMQIYNSLPDGEKAGFMLMMQQHREERHKRNLWHKLFGGF